MCPLCLKDELMTTTQEITFAACPQCQTGYEAPITPIIDVSAEPALKLAFLRGELNVGQCPQCGFTAELTAPVFYHDSEKELALCFAPAEIGHDESQRVIGNLTNRVMNSLPAEQRKAYLLTPQTFLTLESLRKVVLEADGITEEMMRAQAEKGMLMERLFRAGSEEQLKTLIKENDAELDQQFFEIISSMIVQALSDGQQEQAQQLLAFRQTIAELSSQGVKLVAEIDKQLGLQPMSAESLLEQLKNADTEEAFVALVRAGKPLIDYSFFQSLTNQIEALTAAGNETEAQKLQALRSRILDISAKVEEENKKIVERVTKLIDTLLKAPDPEAFIKENIRSFDEPFFAVLAANVQEATQRGQQEVAQKLADLHQQIMAVIQEQIPPEFKLLNELLQLGDLDMIKGKLEENRALITDQFLDLIDRAKADFEGQGQAEVAQMLDQIKEAANSMKQGGIILTP